MIFSSLLVTRLANPPIDILQLTALNYGTPFTFIVWLSFSLEWVTVHTQEGHTTSHNRSDFIYRLRKNLSVASRTS